MTEAVNPARQRLQPCVVDAATLSLVDAATLCMVDAATLCMVDAATLCMVDAATLWWQVWVPLEAGWEQMHRVLLAFKEREGHAPHVMEAVTVCNRGSNRM